MTSSRLRELIRAASPAPWEADAADPSDVVVWGPRQNDDQRLLMNVGGANPHQVGVAFDIDAANAALIVALRNDAEKYADLRDAAKEMLEALSDTRYHGIELGALGDPMRSLRAALAALDGSAP